MLHANFIQLLPELGIPYRLKRFPGTKPYNIRRVVSESGNFTHDITFFHHDARGKRFSAHGT